VYMCACMQYDFNMMFFNSGIIIFIVSIVIVALKLLVCVSKSIQLVKNFAAVLQF